MNVMRRAGCGLVLAAGMGALGVPTSIAAQVGHSPAKSPYTDLEYHQEWTFFTGRYESGKDPAGVAPQPGQMYGLRYDLRLGGPAYLTASVADVQSSRIVLDPVKPLATRNLGLKPWPIYLVDLGIAMNLTGFKSYHQLVPFVSAGVGVASDFKGVRDVGEYDFGTPFAFNFGAGLKWIPTGQRYQIRADVGDHFYQLRYPNSYYQSVNGVAPVLTPSQAKSFWKSNTSVTLGLSFLFFR